MEKDVLKDISESNNRDIVINMDIEKHWSDHIKIMNALKETDLFYERVFSDLPKSNKGNKCYLSYNNKIYAWLEIYSVTKKANSVLVQMFPYLNFVFPGLDNGGFKEEFRYFYDNSHVQ
jgi:hypothetical protein